MSALGAELLRTRRSPAARLSLVGLVVCALSLGGQLLVSAQRTWTSLLMWHVPHVTVFAAVLTALLVAFVERRERLARSGATAWRATPPATQRSARLLVLAGLSLVTNLLVFLPFAPAGLLLGLSDPPVGRLLRAALLTWACGAGWLVIAVALARRTGPWPVVGAGVAWQLTGTVLAESDLWWALPPTWAVRPVLPLIGTHYNGIPLAPDSPVWASPIAAPMLASLVLALVALPAAVLGNDAERRARFPLPLTTGRAELPPRNTGRADVQATGGNVQARAAGRPRPAVALASSLRRTAIVPLTVTTLALLAVVALVYPSSYPDALFGLVVLPAGAAMLAVLAWQVQEPAWRVLLARSARPATLPLHLLGVLGTVVAAVAVVSGCLLAADGVPVADAAVRVVVAVPLGWAAVALTLWLHLRLHVAVALVVAFLGTTGGILFGGSVLAATPLWLAGPAAWAYSATTPGRAAVAVAVSVLVAVVAGAGFVRSASRA